jgi:hypothetical protein
VSGIAKRGSLFSVLAACCAGSVPAPAIEDDSIYLSQREHAVFVEQERDLEACRDALAAGKPLARQYAEKALALLDSHAAPASSWSDTEQRRGEIRSGLRDVLKKLEAGHSYG